MSDESENNGASEALQSTREGEVVRKEAITKKYSITMAQMMVLLNGMLLAIAAYALLSIFINSLEKEQELKFRNDWSEYVSSTLEDLGQSMRSGASLLMLGGTPSQINRDRTRIIEGIPYSEKFSRIFVMIDENGGEWKIYDIANSSTVNGYSKDFYKLLLAEAPSGGGNSIFIPLANMYENKSAVLESEDGKVKEIPFAVVHKVFFSNDSRSSYVVGVTSVGRALQRERFLGDDEALRALFIRSGNAVGDTLYEYMKEGESAGIRRSIESEAEELALLVGNKEWTMSVLSSQDRYARFLARTPLLMLAFGAMLTVFGTLYVRNNEQQALKLSQMNKALAQKNYELNNEVSERERLFQVMRKSERENKAIVNSVSDIIFETSRDGQILFLNDTWRKITGFDIDQALGRGLFDMLHPQDQDEQRKDFQDLVEGKKQAYRTFTRIRTSEGIFRSVEMAVSMLRQDENNAMRVVGTFTDVEERRRAERALTEAEKKYRTIVENAAGGIFQVTPEGQYFSANPAMARTLGFSSPEELLREVKNAHKDVYVDQKARAQFIRELDTIGSIHHIETQVYRKDGSKIWVSESARAVKDDDGSILYYEGSIEDITQRKEAEIKLKDAKVQSDLANRAKSEFLANMSHELRTPLNAIIGFAEIIKDEVLGPVGQEQYKEYSSDIYESGKGLLEIISEILDVSRIEAGDRQINETIVNTDKVIRSVVGMLSQKAEAAELVINNTTENSVPKIIGEELALKQVMFNLLSNAVKYTPAGGRITISQELDADGNLQLAVTDTGIGLDENEIQTALSPFGQVESYLNRSNSLSGAGLGLTLVKSLMDLHGGKLELFSQKGIGTTATVVFPARRVSVKASDS